MSLFNTKKSAIQIVNYLEDIKSTTSIKVSLTNLERFNHSSQLSNLKKVCLKIADGEFENNQKMTFYEQIEEFIKNESLGLKRDIYKDFDEIVIELQTFLEKTQIVDTAKVISFKEDSIDILENNINDSLNVWKNEEILSEGLYHMYFEAKYRNIYRVPIIVKKHIHANTTNFYLFYQGELSYGAVFDKFNNHDENLLRRKIKIQENTEEENELKCILAFSNFTPREKSPVGISNILYFITLSHRNFSDKKLFFEENNFKGYIHEIRNSDIHRRKIYIRKVSSTVDLSLFISDESNYNPEKVTSKYLMYHIPDLLLHINSDSYSYEIANKEIKSNPKNISFREQLTATLVKSDISLLENEVKKVSLFNLIKYWYRIKAENKKPQNSKFWLFQLFYRNRPPRL